MSAGNAPQPSRIITGSFAFGRNWIRRGRNFTAVGLVLVVVIMGTWMFIPSGAQKQPDAYRAEPARSTDNYVAPVIPVVAKPAAAPQPKTEPTVNTQPPPNPLKNIGAGRIEAPAYVYSYGGGTLPEYLQKVVDQAKGGPQAASVGGIDFKPASLPGTKSFTIAHRDYMLMRWSTIMCKLQTEVITGAGGETPFRCTIQGDVKSPTGVVLLEDGTPVGGSYKSVVGEGDKRVIAVTAEAQSPNGVIAEIGGPIADSLGGAGVPGSVDEHWGERIGGALILTLVDSLFQIAQSEIQKTSQNTNINVGGSGSGGGLSGLGQQLLAKTINIPPTITLNQGTVIVLWVTKYVDFSPSYRLVPK